MLFRSVVPEKEPRRLQRQGTMTLSEMKADLPTACDVGTKRNAKGHSISWIGYKLPESVTPGTLLALRRQLASKGMCARPHLKIAQASHFAGSTPPASNPVVGDVSSVRAWRRPPRSSGRRGSAQRT